MDDKVRIALEHFIDYTTTGDKTAMQRFLQSIEEISVEEIPEEDYCLAHNTNVDGEDKQCFLGRVMHHSNVVTNQRGEIVQRKETSLKCKNCPFFFSKEFFRDLRKYVETRDESFIRIINEAQKRRNHSL